MQVGDKGLSHLTNLVQLRRLALQGTAVTTSSMPVVAGFTDLQALDIARTTVDSKGAPAKACKSSSCTYQTIFYNPVPEPVFCLTACI